LIIHYKKLPAKEMICALRFGPVEVAKTLDARFTYIK
jgi:hypothetical protein